MNLPKVCNLRSSRGNVVPNQYRIETDEGSYFQSYRTLIAFRPHSYKNPVLLDEPYWQGGQTRTTNKYLYQFLNLNRREIKDAIRTGQIVLGELNSVYTGGKKTELEDDSWECEISEPTCRRCGGVDWVYLGNLGTVAYFRCRRCNEEIGRCLRYTPNGADRASTEEGE